MDDGDELWRTLILGSFILTIVVWLFGGVVMRVSGRWRDDEGADIFLHQVGPRVWGHCELPGGTQRFYGWILFNRVRLQRHDYGLAHLKQLGFSDEQADKVDGQVTATFELKRSASGLAGVFYGRKFSFEGDKVRSVPKAQSTSRAWRRVTT